MGNPYFPKLDMSPRLRYSRGMHLHSQRLPVFAILSPVFPSPLRPLGLLKLMVSAVALLLRSQRK